MSDQHAFVPADFDVPLGLEGDGFRLEPLGEEHNARDLAAWGGSIAHVRATPGFQGWDWPPAEGMSARDNLRDLARHAADFAARRGFTYTVLGGEGGEGSDEVIGCLYIYPAKEEPGRVRVRSWVRADRAALDAPLYEAVSGWLREAWPFEGERIDYAPR
ncbi:N-acetyltransferase [Streptomyces sp. APSN-46.1]|uniref:N-acetyltransferase n=1 Tax=Streptomyces sp. APSN-46.1 TaxID=2929049 RepID=UPI001FB44678|nr:N-acetyltransferase [Streptomyces sp. APSN-46.1]MCJ1680609.1 N-acetyltransferase [Streptomyces sp. APSN-46.1]